MSLKDKEKWDAKYAVPEYITSKEPCVWLKDNADLLAGTGAALDIASGEGRNAVFAAEKGYETLAIDVSATGLDKARSWPVKKTSLLKPALPIWMTGNLNKTPLNLFSASTFWNDEYFQISRIL